MNEAELRAALDAVLLADTKFLPALLAKFEELQFLADMMLWGRQRTGDGSVRVCFSPGGRMLKVAAQFSNPESSATVMCKLPREYWAK